MIPKIIHYCWFGNNPKGKKETKCIESWKKFCPDYEIVEWNESKVDLDLMPFIRKAYDAKKYAFVSDVIRLWAIYNYGGIYFDTDVELIKSFDSLLENEGFVGFENDSFVNTGQGVGAQKGNQIIKEMFDYYAKIEFAENDNVCGFIGCPVVNTEILKNHGLLLDGTKQSVDGFAVYPADYFNPYDDPTGKLVTTQNTYSIHWYSKSWLDKKTVVRSILSKPLHRLQAKLKK